MKDDTRLTRQTARPGMHVGYVGRREEFVGLWGVLHAVSGGTAKVAVKGMVGPPDEKLPAMPLAIAIGDLCDFGFNH